MERSTQHSQRRMYCRSSACDLGSPIEGAGCPEEGGGVIAGGKLPGYGVDEQVDDNVGRVIYYGSFMYPRSMA